MADNTTLDPGAGGDTIRDVDHAGVKTPVVALDLSPAGAETLMDGQIPVRLVDSGLNDFGVTGTEMKVTDQTLIDDLDQMLGYTVVATGSFTLAGQTSAGSTTNFYNHVLVQLTGTWTGTVSFKGSNDAVNYDALLGLKQGTVGATPAATATANGLYLVAAPGAHFRLDCDLLSSGTIDYQAIAGVPSASRVDGLTNTELRASALPVSGTVTANAGSGPFPVSDNAGSLTVDSTQLPAALAANGGIKVEGVAGGVAQPVSLATNTPDVTDRDARLLGRAKNLDSAGTVIDPATKAQLPAALAAGGGIKVEGVAGGVAQPVSGTVTANAGSGPFPVSDNAGSLTVDAPVGTPAFVRLSDGAAAITALPVTDNAGSLTVDGTVTANQGTANTAANRWTVGITDGTDEATVLPVRTQPATTEKAITTIDLPARVATYQATTAEIASAISIGVKELMTVFKPSGTANDVYITEIVVSSLVTTASTTGGRTTILVQTCTAVGTGGTNLTAADLGGAGASALGTAGNIMQAKTGGGTAGTTFIRREWMHATQPLGRVSESVFSATSLADAIVLRGGTGAGINIQEERVAAHTALVEQVTVSVRWIEL